MEVTNNLRPLFLVLNHKAQIHLKVTAYLVDSMQVTKDFRINLVKVFHFRQLKESLIQMIYLLREKNKKKQKKMMKKMRAYLQEPIDDYY